MFSMDTILNRPTVLFIDRQRIERNFVPLLKYNDIRLQIRRPPTSRRSPNRRVGRQWRRPPLRGDAPVDYRPFRSQLVGAAASSQLRRHDGIRPRARADDGEGRRGGDEARGRPSLPSSASAAATALLRRRARRALREQHHHRQPVGGRLPQRPVLQADLTDGKLPW